MYYKYDHFKRIQLYKDIWERSVAIFSGGKTYSCTGWRIGWGIGPKNLIDKLKKI